MRSPIAPSRIVPDGIGENAVTLETDGGETVDIITETDEFVDSAVEGL